MLLTIFLLILIFHPTVSLVTLNGRNKLKTKYNENLSEMLLHLSAAAYGETESRDECIRITLPLEDEWSRVSTLSVEADFLNNACAGYIVASKKRKKAIIVFRGTKSVEQLLLEAWWSREMGNDFYGMGRVHEYFRNALDAMWKQISYFLNRPSYKKYSLVFTGHSLGGALASLAAAKTVKNGYRPASKVKLYTFGQPRTGSYKFAQNFDAFEIESYRIVFRKDSVPHMPECKVDLRTAANENGAKTCLPGDNDAYYHHGTEIWYESSMTTDSQFIKCDGNPKNEDFNCSNQYSYPFFVVNRYIEQNFWDHRHYFDVSLSNFGKSGCANRVKKPDPERSKLPFGIDSIMRTFGKKLLLGKSKQKLP